jgi:hypothetical protein
MVGITILTIPKGIVSVGLIPGIILIVVCSYSTYMKKLLKDIIA